MLSDMVGGVSPVGTLGGRTDDGNSGTALTINFGGLPRASHKVTLNGLTPVLTLTGGIAGAQYTLELAQDGVGARIPSFSPALLGVAITLTLTANKRDIINLYCDGTNYVSMGSTLNVVTA